MSSTPLPSPSDPPLVDNLEDPRPFVAWFFLMGVVLIVLGGAALAYTALATDIVVVTLGILMLLAGATHAIEIFLASRWRAYLLHAIAAVVYLLLGLAAIVRPDDVAAFLTIFLAVVFFISGALRALTAAIQRYRRWALQALSGLVTLLLGACLLMSLGWAVNHFIGLMVGIELVLRGCGWLGLAWVIWRDRPAIL
jgi:uncharacterized membrane protein HdeD (DUF308 family)